MNTEAYCSSYYSTKECIRRMRSVIELTSVYLHAYAKDSRTCGYLLNSHETCFRGSIARKQPGPGQSSNVQGGLDSIPPLQSQSTGHASLHIAILEHSRPHSKSLERGKVTLAMIIASIGIKMPLTPNAQPSSKQFSKLKRLHLHHPKTSTLPTSYRSFLVPVNWRFLP